MFAKGVPGLLETAYLRDHWQGVANTVIVGMHEDGRIAVNAEGQVKVVEAVARNDAERALLKHCGADWSTGLDELHWELRTDPAVRAYKEAAVREGLLVAPGTMTAWRRAAGLQITGTAVAGLISLVMAFHVDSYPLPFLLMALVAAGIVLRVKCHLHLDDHELTDRGREYERQVLRAGVWTDPRPGAHPPGAAAVVAVRKVSALPDEQLRTQLQKAAIWQAPSYSYTYSTSPSGSSSACSSSSSCSSNSCSSSSCSSSSCSSCSSGSSCSS
ncbi:TIGR04222 domain-containing membrane protein [Streptomyces stramineus]